MASRGSVLGVIPVRLASKRFPEKALASLHGRPLVVHVVERALLASSLDRVVVATDHPRIAAAVRAFGGEVQLTSVDHKTGSDRVWEVASATDYRQIVNIQGDQPGVDPACIDACVAALSEEGVDMATAGAPLIDSDAPPDLVRVVTDPQNFAVAFSRRSQPKLGLNWRHIGIYAYQRATLEAFASRPQTDAEIREGLEQLRVLEYGGRVKVVFVGSAAPAVDRLEDLQAVRGWNS
jgi:3-deoxy-manno-octulosonate cytidylyltransferase (CMP-KDO synthetase)